MTPELPEPSDYPDATSYGLACWKQGMERAAEICDAYDGNGAGVIVNAIRKEITP